MSVKSWEIKYSVAFRSYLIVGDSKFVVPMRFQDKQTAALWAQAFKNSPRSYIPILFDINVKACNAPLTPNDEAEKCVRDYWGIYHNRWMLYVPDFWMHPVIVKLDNRIRFNVWRTFADALKIGKELPNVTVTHISRNERVKV